MSTLEKTLTMVLPIILLCSLVAAGAVPAGALAGGTETPVTTGHGTSPDLYATMLVWEDARNGDTDIYLYDVTSGKETRITADPHNQRTPGIHGDSIVWCDYRTGRFSPAIFLYNLATGTEMQVSDAMSMKANPAIYGNRIVWEDDRNGDNDIFGNGTAPGSETPVVSIPGEQVFPEIWGDLVVWQDDRNGNWDIYLYNLTSREETRITDDPGNQEFPAVWGNRIVWQDDRNGNREIFMNGTAPGLEYSLTPDQPAIDHTSPALCGTQVVWVEEYPGGGAGIFFNDTAVAGTRAPVATLPAAARGMPAIAGDRIVWVDTRNGWDQVFLYTIGGPGTCPVVAFSSDFSGGSAPRAVQFIDQSPAPVTHWFWDFGDGTNSTLRNPAHLFSRNGSFTVGLTAGNPYCRNVHVQTDYITLGIPAANFAATPASDIVPARIRFTDTTLGSPVSWLWDFGDGSSSPDRNPDHTYATAGVYTVSLTAANAYGSNTKTRTDYITVLNGANEMADTSIPGLVIEDHGGQQWLNYNYTTLPDYTFTPNTSVLQFRPPADRGFSTITLYALDGIGFCVFGSNTTIAGNVTGACLQTKEIVPAGFSGATGSLSSVNYSICSSTYPCNATLNTKVWEHAVTEDRKKFEAVALGSTFAHYISTAYTTKITRTNLPAGVTADMHMSVNSAWVASVADGRNQTYIERITDDGLQGEVLATRYLSQDAGKGLDYFAADSPHGLSTFGLSLLSGSGNPLQLVTLSIASHMGPPADSSDSTGTTMSQAAGGGKDMAPAGLPLPARPPDAASPVDPGVTARLYSNANGIITQETTLQSTDTRAKVFIGQGYVARDRDGNPLSSISITAIPPEDLPAPPPSATLAFAGIAYELRPDGATFSPPVRLSFAVPQARWGQDFSVRAFDHGTATWQSLPSEYNAQTGIITVLVQHFCCFALFSESRTPAVTPAVIQEPITAPQDTTPLTPPTALSIFYGMVLWVADTGTRNPVIIAAGIVVVVLAMAVYRRTMGRRGRIY